MPSLKFGKKANQSTRRSARLSGGPVARPACVLDKEKAENGVASPALLKDKKKELQRMTDDLDRKITLRDALQEERQERERVVHQFGAWVSMWQLVVAGVFDGLPDSESHLVDVTARLRTGRGKLNETDQAIAQAEEEINALSMEYRNLAEDIACMEALD
ncbi:hypothetical protein ACHAPU_011304 [Fusarium lateritium]